MATMVKEKRREKRKSKEKHSDRSSMESELASVSKDKPNQTASSSSLTETFIDESLDSVIEATELDIEIVNEGNLAPLDVQIMSENPSSSNMQCLNNRNSRIHCENTAVSCAQSHNIETTGSTPSLRSESKRIDNKLLEANDTYQELNAKLKTMMIPDIAVETEIRSEYFIEGASEAVLTESIAPSAPIFEEELLQVVHYEDLKITKAVRPKLQCIPLEEAIWLYGGIEMAEVSEMSDREEAIVEAGPVSGPDNPLVDLLSTLRSSLMAVDRARTQLAIGFANEENFRTPLWKVEKRTSYTSQKCSCGLTVSFKFTYEQAELMKEKLPVARMMLEGLLRDVQESYCHHQHTALLAHCQIEELISEIIQSNKNYIREALALILQALRLSDGAVPALSTALQRWARALSAALLDGRDLRQLLHLLHQLFRQTRSVQWAASVIQFSIGDRVAAAQAIAILDLLLARPRLETAHECTEDTEDGWEEVGRRGGGGAVREGALRERDLLALLGAFPLRDLVARLVQFSHADIKSARAQEWGDASGGSGVLRACCGVRALVATAARAAHVHATYERLRAVLRRLAARALHALAALHHHCRHAYTTEMQTKLAAELEASFAAGFALCGASEPHVLPAALLGDEAARDYCAALIEGLHDKSPKRLESLSLQLPVLPCGVRVRTVARAAADRVGDYELAHMVMEFLFQTGLVRKSVACKGACDAAARRALPAVLAAHPYLHTLAFHMLADGSQVETLDPSSITALSPGAWRPAVDEAMAVLNVCELRCARLLPRLLLAMDFTAPGGVSLETQLAIGSWLCFHVTQPSPAPEWAWQVLRRLRVHRTCWGEPLDAPAAPAAEPADLFGMAYALLASSWGHCIPLICTQGVEALCRVAAARARDAVHCLAPLMLVMAHSPESISLTPKFEELLSILLGSGPTLVQRALGRGPAPGADLLLSLILAQLEGKRAAGVSRSALLSAWLHALCRAAPPAAALADAAVAASRDWPLLDRHVALLLQEENCKDHVTQAVRNVATAPLLCDSVLRNAHARETYTQLWPRLLDLLHMQRVAGDRIHVDNALRHLGAGISSDELVIYRAATAALSAPPRHPSHLALWRLLLRMYLQRAPSSAHDSVTPVGPLFFCGLIKSRVLSQLHKRLQDTITYHNNERCSLSKNSSQEKVSSTEDSKSETVKSTPIDELLPELTIVHLTGESSQSGDSLESLDSLSSDSSDSESNSQETDTGSAYVTEDSSTLQHMLAYHISAEKMLTECLRWLEEGDRVRAVPHNVDMAWNYVEQHLDAAWSRELARARPRTSLDDLPLPSDTPPPAPTPAPTPFQSAVSAILGIKDRARIRVRKTALKSPVEDMNFKDVRSLLKQVDKHLLEIETLAREWSLEVTKVSSLDSRLFELVAGLRVRRPLPPVRRACANKCAPLTLCIQEDEWLISNDAERGMKKNRAHARARIRYLARPRPRTARTAAALQSIARRVGAADAAAVAARAWRCAGALGSVGVAGAALEALLAELAERCLCNDGKLCAELLSHWAANSSTSLQQSLCGYLVSPRRLRHDDWPRLYTALLRAELPSHAIFSHLSKFELPRWSERAGPEQRREVLQALLRAAQRWGRAPAAEHHVLLELFGVHTCALLTAHSLPAHVGDCARACAARVLPPEHCAHVARAARRVGGDVAFDQLGHLLRELGVIWWEARTGPTGRESARYVAYASHAAALLHALQRAFVAAGVALTYAPEKVAHYAWSTLQESWAPWVCPHPAAPPLLPAEAGDAYTQMLKHFVDTIHQVMLDCPGTEEVLLQQIFNWTLQTHATSQQWAHSGALLGELRQLPWDEHQWLHQHCLPHILQICGSADKEILEWCGSALRGTRAETWLRDGGPLDERLAALLFVFCSVPLAAQTLEGATLLPWRRLPEAALGEALERFFARHHDPSLPYHDLPQFGILLYASELCVLPDTPPALVCGPTARGKRARALSLWARAACSPALRAHAPAHAARVLSVLTNIEPYLSASEGEVEELLGRAMAVLCAEPAPAALPVWLAWARAAPPPLCAACVSAAGQLTAFEPFAALADAAVTAHLARRESGGWADVRRRWQRSHWTDATPLCARARLHAAYGAVRAHEHAPDPLRTCLLALLAADVNFVENEVMVAVWICFACRVAAAGPAAGARAECGGAARGALRRWADEPRRSLLRVVTLRAEPRHPTAQHRLLCRLAQCIITPGSDSAVSAYEASCSAVLGSTSDVMDWGRQPHPRRLPRLAMRLYPSNEHYFKDELDMTLED